MKWWTSLSGEDSKAGGARQLNGSPVAAEMAQMVRLYRDYQPAALVARLEGLTVQALDVVPMPSGESRLRLSNREGAFRVTLESEGAPTQVIYEPAAGNGSGLDITYGDYFSIQGAWYPRAMSIKLADAQQHGIEMHFNEVEFVDKLANRDFHR